MDALDFLTPVNINEVRRQCRKEQENKEPQEKIPAYPAMCLMRGCVCGGERRPCQDE